jgi:hypothetical protein
VSWALLLLYALGGLAVGAVLAAFDPDREHESAILSSVIAGPLGILAIATFTKDQRCVHYGGAPGRSCPGQAYFDVLSWFMPLAALIVTAIGAYYVISGVIVSRRGPQPK